MINPRLLGPLLAAMLLAGSPALAASPVSAELESMYKADQAARTQVSGKPINWEVLRVEDAKRLKRVGELIEQGALVTGEDFANAAMLYQHGGSALSALMAHDLAVIALIKGNRDARWLAAASMDRYLRGIGNLQRFGTQSIGIPGGAMQRQPVDATVPDSLRRVFAVPALAHAMTDSAPPDPSRTAQDPTAAAELEQMFVAIEAQTRAAESGKPVTDWAALNSRGKARRERVRALLGQDQLSTARDYYHAATIMQRGTEPDDYLMAHDLAVAAIINGEARAALVAAGSLDSFLKRTGRPQRYATQVEVTNLGTPQLYPIEPSVPDFLRVQFGAPTLATAEKYVAKLLEGYKKRKVGLVPE